MKRFQQTLARETTVSGIGYITGADVKMVFKPAEANTGIVFVRTDLEPAVSIPANIRYVSKRERRTSLRRLNATVELVEHVMAALGGMRVDNCLIEIDAPETPALDGSSLGFVDAIDKADVEEQDAERKTCVVTDPVFVNQDDSTITAHPTGNGDGYTLHYSLDFGTGSPIHRQSYSIDLTPDSFFNELAPCRTFLLKHEAEEMKKKGYAPRHSAKDVLVFSNEGIVDNKLRFPDECARHKVLDMVGDMALLNRDISGHVVGYKSGHQLNAMMVRRLNGMQQAQQRGGTEPVVDIHQIMRTLPHRFPFLLIDRVVELDEENRAVGIKNVTINEPYFQGHWPNRPVMPGVLQVEAMAQLSGVLLGRLLLHTGQIALILSMNNVKMRHPVVPGDQLRIEVEVLKLKARTAHVHGRCWVGEKVASEAQLRFMLVDADPG